MRTNYSPSIIHSLQKTKNIDNKEGKCTSKISLYFIMQTMMLSIDRQCSVLHTKFKFSLSLFTLSFPSFLSHSLRHRQNKKMMTLSVPFSELFHFFLCCLQINSLIFFFIFCFFKSINKHFTPFLFGYFFEFEEFKVGWSVGRRVWKWKLNEYFANYANGFKKFTILVQFAQFSFNLGSICSIQVQFAQFKFNFISFSSIQVQFAQFWFNLLNLSSIYSVLVQFGFNLLNLCLICSVLVQFRLNLHNFISV